MQPGYTHSKIKVKSVKEVSTPKSVHQLKAYLGLLSYYSKFLPNLSSTLYPLYKLLRKNSLWKWGIEQQKAFEASKKPLTSDSFVTHFEPNLKLTLACDDISEYRIEAVLAHRME